MEMPFSKSILSTVLGVLLLLQSCGFRNPGVKDVKRPSPTQGAVSSIPFLTKEPEIFQANVVVEAFDEGKTTALRNYFIAKNGEDLLIRFDAGKETERILLRSAGGDNFILDPSTKTYRSGNSVNGADELLREVTRGWLTITPGTTFENIGTENGLTKYGVNFEHGDSTESFIFYDEDKKMPVRQEMYSTAEGERNLTFRYEMSGIRLEADKGLFAVPAGYKRAER